MRLSVSEMAKLCGVSVRTLHHYDHIGLLRPETAADSGYRWYGAADVEKMQQILFYRELDFPLKDIRDILADPQYDKQEALRRQRHLLLLKRERLDGLLELLDANLKGERTMEFKGFDAGELEAARRQYAGGAKARWGHTAAWRECQEKAASADWDAQAEGMNDIFRRAAALRESDPAGPEAQALVKEWQDFISAHYYQCTDEILTGLGEMYTADERFQKNLDRFGEGTAAFLSRAIGAYCKA
ncbi:MerR family transcriptional regulator [Dysosmobacter sp.]|uniref:MerR family transcriptional regulator n=1 Tax=Dysosmobacter sp. TaxID=2591382 RepID=UPI002A859BDA|nr:MerR family transcriptional regulator [Dysosmobacter sp.]MDY3985381.1 MerR family transcriptional regulator [Dysosmobacter sp.]